MKKRAWIQREAMNEPKKNTSSSAPKGSSYMQALSYHTKCYIGPGALSLPLAFERSGTLSGLFIVLVVFSLTLRNQAALLYYRAGFLCYDYELDDKSKSWLRSLV